MKSFDIVLNNSKKQIIAQRVSLYESQKHLVIDALKNIYMIDGEMKALPILKKKEMAKKVLEYWSPRTGIKPEGIALLKENVITLNENSKSSDIKKFIQMETRKNVNEIADAFKTGRSKLVIESFKKTIEKKVKKALLAESIRNVVWDIVADKIKKG